ncbi:MAG: TonB-dependent receptor [Bacteroidota bacterium]
MTFRPIIFAVLIVAYGEARAQTSALEQRTTDYLRQSSSAVLLSATRYVPVMLGRGYGTWSSPAGRTVIDGMPFDAFPLNLSSPDYAPFDLILADTIEISQHPSLTETGSFPGGMITLKRSEIPDSLVIAGRLYGGSETGDVILQEYTRDNLPFFNRNKIGFSGAAVISDRIDRFAYRIMGGGFSYFSVGYADRDRILIPYIDLPTFSEPNRNYVGSLELEFGRNFSVAAGVNVFEAWEQAPFLPTFAFFSGALGSVRVFARELIPSVDLFARRDAVSVTMRSQLGTDGGQYESSVASLNPIVRLVSGENLKISLPFEITAHAVDVHDQNRQLFDRDIDRTTWSLGLSADLEYSAWQGTAQARYEKGLNGSFLRSGDVKIRMKPGVSGNLELHLSSVERAPSLLEMYGTFSTWRFRPALAGNDTFRVRGTSSLKPSRSSGVELRFEHKGSVEFGVTAFYSTADNLITRRPLSIIRSAFPGDLVFSGQYENVQRRVFGGVEIMTYLNLFPGVLTEVRYTYTENLRASEIPRHEVLLKNTYRLATHTTAQVSLRGTAKTVWPEFAVDPAQDDKDGIGSNGVVTEHWSVDCSVVQNLGGILFGRDISARVELQNILNRTFRTMPIGVTYDFAVIGYLSVRL